jgi:hypothetical protein
MEGTPMTERPETPGAEPLTWEQCFEMSPQQMADKFNALYQERESARAGQRLERSERKREVALLEGELNEAREQLADKDEALRFILALAGKPRLDTSWDDVEKIAGAALKESQEKAGGER